MIGRTLSYVIFITLRIGLKHPNGLKTGVFLLFLKKLKITERVNLEDFEIQYLSLIHEEAYFLS